MQKTNKNEYRIEKIIKRKGDLKVDLTNYAIKTDLKNVTHVDTSNFALKSNLADLKTEVDQSDIGKLAPVPIDLIKLHNVVKNKVLKNTVNETLVAKVNNLDTSGFILKTKYDADKTELKKIPDSNKLVKNKIMMLKLLN